MGLRVIKIMNIEYFPIYCTDPHVHDYWSLFYFINGTGAMYINGLREEVSDGHVAIIRPYDEHCFIMNGTDTATTFEIKWQFYRETDLDFSQPEWSGIFRDRYGLRFYVQQAIEELSLRPRNWEIMLRSIISSMLVQIDRALLAEIDRVGDMQQASRSVFSYRHALVKRAERYLLAHINRLVPIEEVAKVVAVSPKYLAEIFKQENNQSIKKWIINHRMALAKRELLKYPKKSIRQIALSVGYEDVHYFSRLFKSKVGLSPTKFRAVNAKLIYEKNKHVSHIGDGLARRP